MTLRPPKAPSLSRLRGELEEWNAFFVRHTQRLERCYNLLFGLGHLEGTPSIRRRCEERLAANAPMPPWIRATPEWLPTFEENPTDRIEVVSSYDFPVAAACALAPEPGIAFVFERLGRVGRVDLRLGRKLEPPLTVRRERPLQAACSEDGRFVAIAYESGGIDVLQTEPRAEGVQGERPSWTASCRLPEFEAPVLQFLDDDLWRQDEVGDAVACDIASGVEKRRIPPPEASTRPELVALARVGEATVLAWRGGAGSSIISVIDALGRHPEARTEAAEAKAMVAWGASGVAVAFSDRRLRTYDVGKDPQPRRELALDGRAACLAASGSRLWWITEEGRLCSWAPEAGQEERLEAPGLTLAGARALIPPSKADGLILTVALAASFRLGKRAGRGAVIQAAALRPDGYVALATAGGGYVVIDGAKRAASTLPAGTRRSPVGARADGREVGYVFAVDGEGQVLIGHDDVGHLVDLSTGACVPCELPEGIVSAAGSASGGFWLADISGRVFSLDQRRACRQEAAALSDLPAPPRLSAWPSLVVWTGHHMAAKAVLAPDVVHLQVFFRVRAGRLERVGSREYVKADGVLRTVSRDEARGRMIVIWQGRAGGAAAAKIGTVEDLVAGREREIPVPHLSTDCESAAMADGSRRLFVLTADGAVSCLDADTLAPLATIAGSIPFTGLAEGIPAGRDAVTVAGRERVLRLRFEEGGRG